MDCQHGGVSAAGRFGCSSVRRQRAAAFLEGGAFCAATEVRRGAADGVASRHSPGSTPRTSPACRASVGAGAFSPRPSGARHLPPTVAVSGSSYHWFGRHPRLCAVPSLFYRYGCPAKIPCRTPFAPHLLSPPPSHQSTVVTFPLPGSAWRRDRTWCSTSVGVYTTCFFDDGPGCCWLFLFCVAVPARP